MNLPEHLTDFISALNALNGRQIDVTVNQHYPQDSKTNAEFDRAVLAAINRAHRRKVISQ